MLASFPAPLLIGGSCCAIIVADCEGVPDGKTWHGVRDSVRLGLIERSAWREYD